MSIQLRLRPLHVNTAAMPQFHPAFPLQVPISSANGIGVQMKAARQFARTRQSAPRLQFSREDSQHHLPHQLLVDRYLAIAREPESHGHIISRTRQHRSTRRIGETPQKFQKLLSDCITYEALLE